MSYKIVCSFPIRVQGSLLSVYKRMLQHFIRENSQVFVNLVKLSQS